MESGHEDGALLLSVFCVCQTPVFSLRNPCPLKDFARHQPRAATMQHDTPFDFCAPGPCTCNRR